MFMDRRIIICSWLLLIGTCNVDLAWCASPQPDPARDTISPVYDNKSFPYTWAEIQAGKFTLMPVHWTRHPDNPVIPQGMNARPIQIDSETVRVYYGRRGKGGGIHYFDVHPNKPEKLKNKPVGPFITTGPAGSYDDDWVLCPEPIQVTDTHIRMYYAAKKSGSFFNKVWSLACADSYDNGKTWKKFEGNPILTATDQEWESGAVGFTSVEKDSTGWRMWYLGTNTSGNAVKQIGYATSKDGLHWNRYADNPVIAVNPDTHWEKGAIAVARMIKDGKLYRTWYACYPQNNTYAIGCAESADGIHWFRSPSNPVLKGDGEGWDGQMTAYPGTVRVGDRYLMWYSGNGYGGSGIGLATAKVPQGVLLYRTGETEKTNDGWSDWMPVSEQKPKQASHIQFAVVQEAE